MKYRIYEKNVVLSYMEKFSEINSKKKYNKCERFRKFNIKKFPINLLLLLF